ncbi:28903_t:CDS:2, partial [Dentiscutata erythropus]
IEENEEFEETVAYLTTRLAVDANNIYYSTVSVEYPSTSPLNDKGPSGFVTVYNIQYSLGPGGQTKVKCPFFGNIIVTKDQRRCQGVTICPHADDQIKSAKHCNVDFDSKVFKAIKNESSNRTTYTNTLAFYLAIIKKSCPKTLSNGLACAGLPVLRRIKEHTLTQYRANPNQSNNRTSLILQCKDGYFIGCSLWINGDSWHRFIPIPESCDVNLIRRLLEGESFDRSLIQDRCCTILPNTTHRKFCSIQDRLKTLIETASMDLEHITPRRLISANKDRVVDIFQEFATSDEDGALEWGNYYMKPWRLASLNYNYSNIAEEDWRSAGENTNAAESAHADANREGTQMRKRLDERRFAMCECQDQYNIPKTGRSSGPIAKATKSIKKFEPSKRKKNPPTNKRTSNSNAATANNEELNDLDTEIAKREKLRKLELIDYEFQHQKEMLDIEKRAKLANLRAQELANIEKEKALGINKD